jgi:hypothetical protein
MHAAEFVQNWMEIPVTSTPPNSQEARFVGPFVFLSGCLALVFCFARVATPAAIFALALERLKRQHCG